MQRCGFPPATDVADFGHCIPEECLSPLSAGFNVKTCCKDTTFCRYKRVFYLFEKKVVSLQSV